MPLGHKIRTGEMTTTTGVASSVAPLLGTAHLVVLSAKTDPSSAHVIASTLANAASGSPDAIAIAQVFEHATKVANRAKYVRTWLYGEGAAIATRGR